MIARGRHLIAFLAVAALVAAGCGGSDDSSGKGLPATAVTDLTSRLDEIQRRFDDGTKNGNVGACNDIQDKSFADIADILDGLPQDVDPDIRDAVDESFSNLQTLTQDGCAGTEQTDTETETTPEPTTPEDTATQETVPEETSTEEQPTPDQTTPDTGDGKQKKGKGGGKDTGGGGLEAPSDGG